MGLLVCNSATLQCTFGSAPGSLIALPDKKLNISVMPSATIMDHKPVVNIPVFATCSSPTNPAVIAATAAKLGVFTPVPCVPICPAPWAPGDPTIMISNVPALNNLSKLVCANGGVIQIVSPGQTKTMVK